MKIVVFGCQQIAVDALKYLSSKQDVELSLVITYELPLDETYSYESVVKYCNENSINVDNPKSVTSDVVKKVLNIKPDLIL